MDNFRSVLGGVIDAGVATGNSTHMLNGIMEKIVEAIGTPGISGEIDTAIVRTQLGKMGTRYPFGDKVVAQPVDVRPQIFAAVYDTERRCHTNADYALRRALDAVGEYAAAHGESKNGE